MSLDQARVDRTDGVLAEAAAELAAGDAIDAALMDVERAAEGAADGAALRVEPEAAEAAGTPEGASEAEPTAAAGAPAGETEPEAEPEAGDGVEPVAREDHPELRALLTRWSASGDPAFRRVGVKSLGDRVELEGVVRSPFATVEVQAQRLEVRRTPFEVPAPWAPAEAPAAASLAEALAVLPRFEAPRGELSAEEDVERLAWTETVPCEGCEAGQAACEACGGDGRSACACGDGTVEEMVEAVVDCTVCNGTGKTSARVCIPCGGSGSVECAWCRGTGRWPLRDICEHCKEGRTPCGHCNSTGEVFGRCATCGGPGKLPRMVPEPRPCPTCEGTAKVPCGACGETGKHECERCKGSGSFVRGEYVRRALHAGEVRQLTDGEAADGVREEALASATTFVLRDMEAVEGVAARLAETPSVAQALLEFARQELGDGGALHGRYATASVVTFEAILGAWRAPFAAVEAGKRKTFGCTSDAKPPVDPKAYGRLVARENTARTAAYEEAVAASDGIFAAAMEQYRREVAAAEAAAAEAVAPAPSPADPSPSDEPMRLTWGRGLDEAPEPEPAGLKWGRGLDDPPEEPAEQSKERKARFGLLRGLRRSKDESGSQPSAEPNSAPAEPPKPVVPAIPVPVRREVPPPDLLPPYEALPASMRIA